MTSKPIIQQLASAITARLNCIQQANHEWREKWEAAILEIQEYHLPSGSGVDRGCTVDLEKSTGDRIIIHIEYHHMNDGGMYDGWTEYTVTVTPAFDGFNLRISGRNRNDIKEYLGDLFYESLSRVESRQIA